MATKQWTGPSGAAWATDGDWQQAGAPTTPPTESDTALLGTADGGLVAGDGTAGSLQVSGTYTLDGTIDIAGAAAVSGDLALLGTPVGTTPTLTTLGGTVTGTVALTLADWTDTGTIAIGAGGMVSLRDAGGLAGSVIAVAAGGLLDIGPAASVAAASIVSDGLLIALGSLVATAITLEAGSRAIAQGDMEIGTLTVDPGALLAGAPLITGAAGAAAEVINNGTIDGAVAADPLEIAGRVSGTGTLLVDQGGGLQLDGAVGAGQTVVFAPGDSPIYVDEEGAAGGELLLTDVTQFAGTISGLTYGDRLYVGPVNGDTVAAAVLADDRLELEDAGGTILATLTLTDTDLTNGTTFQVFPGADSLLFPPPDAPTGVAEIIAIPPAPQLTSAGSVQAVAGTPTTVPPLTVYDPAGYEAGDTFTLTLTAPSGTFGELLSLPAIFNGLETSFASALISGGGDGTFDAGTTPDMTLSISGTGTGTLTLRSDDLFLLNFQASFITYDAGSAGGGGIGVTLSNGVSTVAETVPVFAYGAAENFSWVPGGSGNAADAANWMSGGNEVGPPAAGDPVTLGPGSYSVTGDFAAGALTVTGDALTQGAIYVSGTASGPALVVDGGGIFGSAGFIDVVGSAAVGLAGAGELDLVGPINVITGDLVVGDGGPGYFRSDGVVAVSQDVLVGLASAGQLDVTGDPLTASGNSSLLSFVAALSSANGVVGAGAGEQGFAAVDGGEWQLTGTLTVGGAGTGVLETATYGFDHGQVRAAALVIGGQAGGTGTVENGGGLYITQSIGFGPGSNGLLVNTGNIELGIADAATAPGTLTIGNADTVLTAGELDADAINIDAGGTLLGTAGEITTGDVTVAAVGTLALTDTALNATDIGVQGGTADFYATAPQVTGVLSLTDGGRYLQDQAIATAGTLSVASLSTAAFNDGAGANLGSLSVGGTLTLGGGALNLSGPMTVAQGAQVIASGQIGTGYGAPPVPPIDNSGTIAAQGGALVLSASSITAAPGDAGVLAIDPDATLVLEATPDATQTITFAPDATLSVFAITALSASGTPPTTDFAAPLAGFGSGGDSMLFNTDGTYSILGYNDGVLSLRWTEPDYAFDPTTYAFDLPGTGTLDLNIPGAISADNFTLTSTYPYAFSTDPSSTTLTENLPCFRAGTRLRTPRGEIEVERLAVGDTVLTAAGRVRTVRWIGHRQLDFSRHPSPERVFPVRIAAGAFGPGRPRRPLYLSPDHAIYFDGVLIPIKYLRNGINVRKVRVRTAIYYHVELERHDVLLADGLPAESFLDTGDRAGFDNAGTVVTLHPEWGETRWEAARHFDAFGAAPLRVTGPEVARARTLLSDNARRARERQDAARLHP
jgi:hypothetical protein